MPAQEIGDSAVDIALYDVLGFDSPRRATFVGHVALSSRTVSVSRGVPASVRLAHMTPPLLVDAPFFALRQTHGAAGLDDSERDLIATYVRQLQSEYQAEKKRRQATGTWSPDAGEQFRADQYMIRPHVRLPDDERPYHQISCAGFVQEAYHEAGIVLVDTAEANLPPCWLETLRTAYAEMAPQIEDVTFRVDKGLVGDGPWPILLPGYIMHALDREREEILASPFRATPGDECFPRQQTTVESSS